MADCFKSSPLRQAIVQWLQQTVPDKRLQHSLRVEAMATTLAQHHGLAIDSVQQASIMHDLAKCLPPQTLLDIAQTEGWHLEPAELDCPHLLHAPVGAVIARDRFGVEDSQILAAIANHTLGSPDMDAISCVVYLADTLEPGRGDTPSLRHLRQLSSRDLRAAVYETCVFSLRQLLEYRRPIHPRTVLTHNEFLKLRPSAQGVNSAA